MPPPVFRPLARVEESQSTPVLELTLITVAVLLSITLAVLHSSRAADPVQAHRSNISFSCFAFISTVSALLHAALFITALILSWTERISLDALTAIIFGLIPGFFSIPQRHVVLQIYLRRLMRQRRSLQGPQSDFRWVTFSRRACGDDPNAGKWRDLFDGACQGPQCETRMFIRQFPEKEEHSVFSTVLSIISGFFRPCISQQDSPLPSAEEQQLAETRQWHGIRIGHTANFVVLRDIDHGIRSWWWTVITSASHLVDDTARFRLRSQRQMVNALVLLSDIVSIGDLVLEHWGDYFEMQLQHNSGVRASISATPGLVCNLILNELGMDEEWGRSGPEIVTMPFPKDSRRKYGIMFLILAEKSNMFSVSPVTGSRISGRDIVDELVDRGNAFGRDSYAWRPYCAELTQSWLMNWGCSLRSLNVLDGFE